MEKNVLEKMAADSYKPTMQFRCAYYSSLQLGNNMPNFDDYISDYEVPRITKDCLKYGIRAITLTYTPPTFLETVSLFQDNGWKVVKISRAKLNRLDYLTNEYRIVPALELNY